MTAFVASSSYLVWWDVFCTGSQSESMEVTRNLQNRVVDREQWRRDDYVILNQGLKVCQEVYCVSVGVVYKHASRSDTGDMMGFLIMHDMVVIWYNPANHVYLFVDYECGISRGVNESARRSSRGMKGGEEMIASTLDCGYMNIYAVYEDVL